MKLKNKSIRIALAILATSLFMTSTPAQAYGVSNEQYCLAQNIYFESRGEPKQGQLAVALVTINRAKNKEYPNTICGVVNQGCQFSWVCDGKSDTLPVSSTAGKQALAIASEVLYDKDVVDITNGALFFHATYAKPSWRKRMEKTIAIGNHIFYRRG